MYLGHLLYLVIYDVLVHCVYNSVYIPLYVHIVNNTYMLQNQCLFNSLYKHIYL